MAEAPSQRGNGVAVDPTEDSNGDNSPLAAISRAMVSLYKEEFGRGPVKARSHWAGPDALVCTLEQSFTKAERNLRQMGEHQRLRDIRMFFQYASVKRFIAPIEETTGRTVRAFISGVDTEEDVAAELFLFYPRGEEGPSRAEKAPAETS